MSEKIRDVLILGVIAAVIFTAGYFTSRQTNRDTVIRERTVEFIVPGGTDTVKKYIPIKKEVVNRDSIDYWKAQYDSISKAVAKGDTTESDDSTFAQYFLPYKAVIKDTLTENHLTILPLNPEGTRVRLDSTKYNTMKFRFTYLDTTINVIRGNDLKTYGIVATGAAIGAAAGDEIGAAIGASAALLFDWIFF